MYPDIGVAAMLRNSWQDLPYRISSLVDRRPIDAEDELIVVAAPDPQGEGLFKFSELHKILGLGGLRPKP